MRVLFVDCDEVLNSTEHPGQHLPNLEYGSTEYYTQELDPFHIAVLNDIAEKTGAVVVLSTSWRTGRPLNHLRETFKIANFKGFIIGDTPRLYRDPEGRTFQRWEEIKLWLDHARPGAFCILDDIDDMGPLSDHHICTTPERGLLPEHVEQAIEILNR